ncbi:Acg family FMN-binding oxidoreductase [Smaragdicoccus niigatensis]|uniref:Acg family FMN-binding oxidoreductase n=1 Tax=Smaragdicoccus niigatensis TaxID=359359 RepID=UPI00037E8FA1|nr:nitroreductase family protein [Smaragdicoccus niigatensis]
MTTTLPATETITRAVALASRAPSLHNSQPWRWKFDRAGLNLFTDRTRLIPSTDPTGRELMLSCGATLDHLRAAMASIGWKTAVERFPNPNNLLHLAQVTFAPSEFVTEADRKRARAIEDRRTDRLPFGPPIGWTMFETVVRPLLPDDVEMTVVSEGAMSDIRRASELADNIRRYDSRYHAALHDWTSRRDTNDGVPADALLTADENQRVPAGRAFPMHDGGNRRPAVIEDSAKIVVLSTDSDQLTDLLRCGEAMSTVLLEATMSGYATCPLTHIVELQSSRSSVKKGVGGDRLPQVLIRIGSRPEQDFTPPQTDRRPVSEILEIQS